MRHIRTSSFLPSGVAAVVAAFAGAVVHAQVPAFVPPDAGSLLRQNEGVATQVRPSSTRPLATPDAGVRVDASNTMPFDITGIDFQGNQAIRGQDLRAHLIASGLLEPGSQPQTTNLFKIQQAVAAVVAMYRQQGYGLAMAHVPQQTLGQGPLKIEIYEGQLGALQLSGTPALGVDSVRRILSRGMREGATLNTADANEALYILGEQPGVGGTAATLKPGSTVGSTDLDVRAQRAPNPHTLVAFVNNHGSRYASPLQVGVQYQGDNLSESGAAERINVVAQAGLPIDDGRSASLRGSVSALVPAVGRMAGLRGGITTSVSIYQLGREFKSLNASGRSYSLSADLSYPVLRRFNQRVDMSGSYGQVEMRDNIGSTGVSTQRRVRTLNLALEGNHQHDEGLTTWRINPTVGMAYILGDAVALAADTLGAHVQGAFTRWNLSLSRQQSLAMLAPALSATQLSLRLSGQLASKNLDSSQKFTLGGPHGVRAYPTGEAAGDDGWLARVQLSQGLVQGWTAYGGADAGEVRAVHNPFNPTVANSARRTGLVLGVTGEPIQRLVVDLSLAARTSAASTSAPDSRSRAWLQGSYSFF